MKLLYFSLIISILSLIEADKPAIKVFVVVEPSRHSANYHQFIASSKHYGIEVTEIEASIDNHKYELLNEALKPFKDDFETIILYAASQDIVFTKPLDEIVKNFQDTDSRVLFAADDECLPSQKYQEEFPTLQGNGLRFLNSDLIIGFASDIYHLTGDVTEEVDQLYFLKRYLDRSEESKLKIDHYAEVFQVLTANSTVKLSFEEDKKTFVLRNENHWTEPGVLLGRGANGLITLNRFTDYINGARDNTTCLTCNVENKILHEDYLPVITLGIFIFYRTPFLRENLEKIARLNYPKSKISVLIASTHKIHDRSIIEFKKRYAGQYAKMKYMGHEYNYSQLKLLQLGMEYAVQRKSDYYFVTDSAVHLENENTLRDLIELNKDFVAPILTRPNTLWSSFWGDLDESGYYKRSFDYVNIINGDFRGVWNVPYVAHAYLLHISAVPKLSYEYTGNWFDLGKDFLDDPEMTLCNNARRAGLHIFATNMKDYGHLVLIDKSSGELYPDLPYHLHEFYELLNNPEDWHKRYIHPDYWKYRNGSMKPESPCQDVYRFRVVNNRFCEDLIEIMETIGQWSSGTNNDPRIPGGYENVPTVDVHMSQVGLDLQWKEFMRRFVMPLQRIVFDGHYEDPPRVGLAFVVRYRPEEQPELRPHNDASTYTISIALNNPGEDFQGGGVRFVRYNCSVTDSKRGEMIMHPGRLTHYHEGLPTTGGTRYIAVSFNDP